MKLNLLQKQVHNLTSNLILNIKNLNFENYLTKIGVDKLFKRLGITLREENLKNYQQNCEI